MTGLGRGIWIALTVLLTAGVIIRLVQMRRRSVIAWQAFAVLVLFWGLTALARSDSIDPYASRYIFAASLPALLLLASIGPEGRFLKGYAIAFAVVVLAVLPHNVAGMNDGSDHLQKSASLTRAEWAAIEAGRDSPEQGRALRDRPGGDPRLFGATLCRRLPASAGQAAGKRSGKPDGRPGLDV